MDIVTSTTPEVAAGTRLSEILRRHQERPVLLMLAGGSALSLLTHIDEAVLGPHITITTLDERFSTDPVVNNFLQITVTDFYKKAVAKGAHTISTSVVPEETLTEAGARFDAALHNWREQHPEGSVVATIGVGSDGHVAGIFPGDFEANFSSGEWALAYTVPADVHQYPKRITVTYTFIRSQIEEAIVFITGQQKLSVFEKLHEGSFSLKNMPASIIREMKSVTVTTDLS
jgi:6-phosphogluconolactonase/glucosamine-6-phosphate isomerase/deaminase